MKPFTGLSLLGSVLGSSTLNFLSGAFGLFVNLLLGCLPDTFTDTDSEPLLFPPDLASGFLVDLGVLASAPPEEGFGVLFVVTLEPELSSSGMLPVVVTLLAPIGISAFRSSIISSINNLL